MDDHGIDDAAVERVAHAAHGDPFAVLGIHPDASGQLWLRVMLPGAAQVAVLDAGSGELLGSLRLRHGDGFFEGRLGGSERPNYRLQVRWAGGNSTIIDDPYRFPPVLGELDVWLLGEGSHLRPYEVLGATQRIMEGAAGTSFAVWAPNASQVSVVGDFNAWDARRHPMRARRECGVWEIFLPGVGQGDRYKFRLRSREGRVLPEKADPYALQSEYRPATASVVARMPSVARPSPERQSANALDAPVSIYEVHLGSWRRKPEDGNRFLSWDELADTLVPYAVNLGFTHLELMPISEHPFDGSWGYQPIGLYSPTARFGDAPGFRRFVDSCHAAGLGVLLDWVPAHFPSDAHGLAEFDGTHLYDYADPREGFHQDWNTLIYNLGRTEVSNFLVANALFWLERYDVDGLRVDAVASMLYRDYSRKAGEWIPNHHGGRENLETIAFLRRMNETVGVERPQAITLAEESTAFPAVSRPVYAGGLGFHYKWNMGWMHDTLAYFAHDPAERRHHHGQITFSLVYAFDENFVLPLSHDEVVHGKGSMLTRMPGDRWQQFANLRTCYGFMFGHPGKKLLFMGCEFAQEREWNFEHSLDWHLLDEPSPTLNPHAGIRNLVRDLNAFYRRTPALHQRDFDASGFEWISAGDAERSVLAFVRRGADPAASPPILVVCNFTPTPRLGLRLGVPAAGVWRECLNTDAAHYGGSNLGTPLGAARSEPVECDARPQSIVVDLPPLATVMFEWDGLTLAPASALADPVAGHDAPGRLTLEPGRPWPMGAHWDGTGVNIAVFSANAQAVDVCIFESGGTEQIACLRLPAHTNDVWHGHITGARVGMVYGLRAHGPWRPDKGLRFNPTKLLLDPCAREIVGEFVWSDAQFAADRQFPRQMNTADNAAVALKARVVDDSDYHWGDDRPPATPMAATVIYEVHVKGYSMLNPQVPENLRGTYAGLAHPASIGHLKRLGITALSVLPVHHHVDEERLAQMGLVNYWGYNTIGFFSPDPRLATAAARADGRLLRDEFRGMVKALHAAGIEVLLDVVYNHSAESDSTGPCISFQGLDNASYYRLDPAAKLTHENHTGCGNTIDLRQPRVLQLVLDSLRYWVTDMHVDGFRFDLATVLGRGEGGAFDRRGAFFTAAAQDPALARAKLIAEPWDIGPGGYQVGGFPRGWPEWNDRFRDDMRAFWLGHPSSRGAFAQRLCASSDIYQGRARAPAESVNYVISHDGFTLRDLVSYNEKHNQANGEDNRDGTGNNLANNCGVEGPSHDPDIERTRARLQRALLATTLLAQGTPMIAAGDELGHSQGGNNNPYCLDSPVTWIDWEAADADLIGYTARVIALRRAVRPFGNRWYTGLPNRHGLHDLTWLRSDGETLERGCWSEAGDRVIACLIGEPGRDGPPLLLIVNAAPTDRSFLLPAGRWKVLLDTVDPLVQPTNGGNSDLAGTYQTAAHSLLLFARLP